MLAKALTTNENVVMADNITFGAGFMCALKVIHIARSTSKVGDSILMLVPT